MGDRLNFKEEEFDINFSDTRSFACQKWSDAIVGVQQTLSPADQQKIKEPRDWQTLYSDIRRRGLDKDALPATKRLLNHLQLIPRTLATLIGIFTKAISPNEADFNVLWGLLDLNIALSCTSTDKLTRTVSWTKRLRSVLELFNRCLDVCEDLNEARLAMVDVLEFVVQILGESVQHLRRNPTESEAKRTWKALESRINEYLSEIETAVKHLNEITSYSTVNHERQVKNLSLRHAPVVLPEEHCTFPMMMIPRQPNEYFYGRMEELERIDHHLDYRNNSNLRTYTIYGRRGVGKTDIALQYAYTNPAGFDAIFWVQCETSVSLRQSFTDMAVSLELPGADRNGHHEENQVAVLKWLKTTRRKWLLIFDNAERESFMRGYWPIGAAGAILITSRKYYNFTNDAQRKGDTVKPFNDRQSWDLLMKLLGPDWQDLDRKGLIKASEEMAAKELTRELGGLALAIQQAAQLIKDPTIGGNTIKSTYELFKEHKMILPPRPSGERSVLVHSLDTLWNMTFSNLTRNARDLLSVLSLLAPDGILIDLFLPRNQSALDGKLNFCKQHPTQIDPTSQASLSTVITAPPPLQAAIAELAKFRLIKQERRELWAHRVVQEAMNYHSDRELQDYFDSASAICFEAFPKQTYGDYFTKEQKGTCQSYIPHGIHLAFEFANLHRADARGTVKGSTQFIGLLSNCAWHLFEASDYELCLRIVDIAWSACDDKDGLQYSILYDIAGTAYYELNKLSECRKNWEKSFKIQLALLPEDDLYRSNSYHNMGMLESAAENVDGALAYFKRAIAIRSAAGDMAANLLANSYLSFELLGKSEALFFRSAGADAHFMAHVHYAYGNLEYAQKRWLAAKRSYETSLQIGLATGLIHPVTAAAYYSLGCVEYERRNHDNARGYLDKAMTIAQLRSPNRDDGTIARVLWKMSVVLEDDTFGTYQSEANEMRIRAEVAWRTLSGNGEGGLTFVALDEDGNADANEVEDSFDALVPEYLR